MIRSILVYRRHGYGHMFYRSTGDMYHGEWRRGKREGKQGAYLWAESGSLYVGQWMRGERGGRGHFVYGKRRLSEGIEGMTVFSEEWKGGRAGESAVALVLTEDGQIGRLDVKGERRRRPWTFF